MALQWDKNFSFAYHPRKGEWTPSNLGAFSWNHLELARVEGISSVDATLPGSRYNQVKLLLEQDRMRVPPRNNALTVMHQAALEDDLETAKLLLLHDPSLSDASERMQRTPIHVAASAGSYAMLGFLLRQKASRVYDRCRRGWDPMHYACYTADCNMRERCMRLLLQGRIEFQGVDASPTSGRQYLREILVHAFEHHCYKAACTLMMLGADGTKSDVLGLPKIGVLANCSDSLKPAQAKALEEILSQGAAIENHRRNSRFSWFQVWGGWLLHSAVTWSMNYECVKLLVDAGASVNSPVPNLDSNDSEDPDSPLQYQNLLAAALEKWYYVHKYRFEYIETIKLLVRRGAKLDESQPDENEAVTRHCYFIPTSALRVLIWHIRYTSGGWNHHKGPFELLDVILTTATEENVGKDHIVDLLAEVSGEGHMYCVRVADKLRRFLLTRWPSQYYW